MTSLRKKEREYSVLRVVAGRVGDETLMTPSRASRVAAPLAPTGFASYAISVTDTKPVGASGAATRLAREGNFECAADN
jgi:hypothetical protein